MSEIARLKLFFYEVFRIICHDLHLAWFRAKWRKLNSFNTTYPEVYFPIEKVSVGKGTYGPLYIMTFSNSEERICIGNYCSIAKDVTFLLGGEHDYKYFFTYPFNQKLLKKQTISRGKIIVEDDVWIGYGTTILSGVTIGTGSVIGAKSIVAKDIPPYSIFVGNKVVKKRFNDEIINKIGKIDYKKLWENELYRNFFEFQVNDNNINELLELYRKEAER